jgi:hypothetical protein
MWWVIGIWLGGNAALLAYLWGREWGNEKNSQKR